MRLFYADLTSGKGWFTGWWDSELEIAVSYARTGIDEPHLHEKTFGLYLIATGNAEIQIETQTVRVSPGQMLLIEPGEAHTFLSSSPNYFYFVLHLPLLRDGIKKPDKFIVSRNRLGI